MISTARKFLPAVAVMAVLGTGWASATTNNNNNDSNETRATSAAARTTASGSQPQSLASADAAAAQSPGVAPPTSSPTSVSATTAPSTLAATPPTDATAEAARASHGPPRRTNELANCAAGEGTYRPATEAEFRTVMTGVWLLCQSPSFFGTPEAGMELRADGRWSKLERRPNGSLARAAGWENEGAWETIDTSAMNGRPTYQINFHVDGGGTGIAVPDFGEGSSNSEVTKVRLSNHGLFVADYVPASPDTKISPVPFPPAPGKGCEAREEPYAPASEAEFRTVMTRAWLLCGAPSFFGTDEEGLEFRADGRWSKLHRTDNGSLVRGDGPDGAGAWETIDTSAMNGRPTYQINLYRDGGGVNTVIPAFAGQDGEVSKVRLANYVLFVADYIPAPARTPVTGP